jgi:hypothetical protein
VAQSLDDAVFGPTKELLIMSRVEPADDSFDWPLRGGDATRSDRRARPHAAPADSDLSRSSWPRDVAATGGGKRSSAEELAFFAAVQDFKRVSGRSLPTWTEILQVLEGLGYQRTSQGGSPPSASAIS